MIKPATYQFVRPDLPYSQMADIVRGAVSTAVAPFHQGDGFNPDLVSMVKCTKFGESNGDGTYKPDTPLDNTFHINYGARSIGQLVVDGQVTVRFYGEHPLSIPTRLKSDDGAFETVPRDREAIEQAIIRELAAQGLPRVNDISQPSLLP
ncbi:MAG: hypothetical protein AABX32_03120 [Nanoarchaeota archaeon]